MDSLPDSDCNLVLRRFMTLCNFAPEQLGDNLASNSVLEWFGRTFKHKQKILDFLIRNHAEEFEQHFTRVQPCQAFEERDTHILTRKTPPENLEISVAPDPLVEEEKFCLEEQKTPPRTRKINNSPPPAPIGAWKSFQDLSDDELEAPSTSSSPSTPGVPEAKKQCLETFERSGSEPVDQYSNLFYLEATGATRTTKKVKHRLHAASPSVSSPATPPQSSYEEDDCNLKISYRIHQETKEFQFALIIYSPLAKKVKSRRNLQKEFEEHVDPAKAGNLAESPQTPGASTFSGSADNSTTKNETQSTRKVERKRNLRF